MKTQKNVCLLLGPKVHPPFEPVAPKRRQTSFLLQACKVQYNKKYAKHKIILICVVLPNFNVIITVVDLADTQ